MSRKHAQILVIGNLEHGNIRFLFSLSVALIPPRSALAIFLETEINRGHWFVFRTAPSALIKNIWSLKKLVLNGQTGHQLSLSNNKSHNRHFSLSTCLGRNAERTPSVASVEKVKQGYGEAEEVFPLGCNSKHHVQDKWLVTDVVWWWGTGNILGHWMAVSVRASRGLK